MGTLMFEKHLGKIIKTQESIIRNIDAYEIKRIKNYFLFA